MRKWIIVILAFYFLFWFTATNFGLYFNILTDSMPLGIYRRVYTKPETGSIAATCLTEEIADYGLRQGYLIRGRCLTGTQPVMKKVYAVKGDYVSFINNQVAINGIIYTKFKILKSDSKGRDVKRFSHDSYIMKDNEYFLLSDYKANSWDSRYWGAVDVLFSLEPVFVLPADKKG